MKLSILKYSTIIISLLTFTSSLFFDAFSYQHQKIETIPSIYAFLIGSIIILGGGLFEWLIWMANPLCVIVIISLLFNKKVAVNYAVVAVLLSSLFLAFDSVLAAESGMRGKIVSINIGYFLWLSSVILLSVGTFFYFKYYETEETLYD